jgi:hypothetical protein
MAPEGKMKQWVTSQDGLENLKFTEAEIPTPKSGEVLVKINAVSLNYRDTEGTSATFLCPLVTLLIMRSDHGLIWPPRLSFSIQNLGTLL